MTPSEILETLSEMGIELEQDALLVMLVVLLAFMCRKLDKIQDLLKKQNKLSKKVRRKK